MSRGVGEVDLRGPFRPQPGCDAEMLAGGHGRSGLELGRGTTAGGPSPAAAMNPGDQDTLRVPQAPGTEPRPSTAS